MQGELKIFTAVAPTELVDGVADEPSHGDPVFPGHDGELVVLLLIQGNGKADFGGHGILIRAGSMHQNGSFRFRVMPTTRDVNLPSPLPQGHFFAVLPVGPLRRVDSGLLCPGNDLSPS